jgi:superfamily I DNA/RNA helicase
LSAANAVIKKNLVRRGKQLWSDKGTGPKIGLCTYKDEEEEAQGVAERINAARIKHRVPWSDFAILFRTNAQSRPLETALRKADIPYRVIGAQSFFDRREVRDFVAYLKMFLNPNDDISLLRIANVPARGLSEPTMERFLKTSQERKCSVFQAMKNPALLAEFPGRTRESIEGFVHFVEHTRQALSQSPGAAAPRALQQWADHFLSSSGYIDELRRSEKSHDAADTRVRNLTDLVAQMDPDDPGPGPLNERLENFLENVTLDSDRDKEDESAGNQVTLITMHSCKGLEFPQVFIVGAEDGFLPFRREGECNMDEERRLFYVAITRAMFALTISHCAKRKKYGKPVTCQPSPFLTDLPPDLVENEDAKAAAPVSREDGKSRFSAILDSI